MPLSTGVGHHHIERNFARVLNLIQQRIGSLHTQLSLSQSRGSCYQAHLFCRASRSVMVLGEIFRVKPEAGSD